MDKKSTLKWLAWGMLIAGFFMASPLWGNAGEIPESLELQSLSELYEGVSFDHLLHMDMVGNCAACHHHGTGDPVEDENCARCHSYSKDTEVVSCGSCHPLEPFSPEYLREKEMDANRYHRDMPGLKAAYHQSCLGCHNEMGGPTGCQDCHPRTEAGDALFRAGAYAPESGAAAGHH